MNEELNLKEFYNNSEANIVNLPNGEKLVGDLVEFYKVVDFFASQYGLGGCRSLEEFSQMINTSDPIHLKCLQLVAEERLEKQWGTGKDKPEDSNQEDVDIPEEPAYNEIDQGNSKATTVVGKNGKIKRFLKTWGANSSDLTKAQSKLESGKIKLKDYGWVNKDNLKTMTSEQFKKLKSDIVADNKKSINFKVSMETMINKVKNEQ